jgi:hypothetical protein
MFTDCCDIIHDAYVGILLHYLRHKRHPEQNTRQETVTGLGIGRIGKGGRDGRREVFSSQARDNDYELLWYCQPTQLAITK